MGLWVGAHFYLEIRERAARFFAGPTALSTHEDETAITAIHQGSGGLLRKANHLARGALVAAANEKRQTASAEHVRLAATELI